MTPKQKRRRAAIRGAETRRKRREARKLENARLAVVRLSIGDVLNWVEGIPGFVVVGLDYGAGKITLNVFGP